MITNQPAGTIGSTAEPGVLLGELPSATNFTIFTRTISLVNASQQTDDDLLSIALPSFSSNNIPPPMPIKQRRRVDSYTGYVECHIQRKPSHNTHLRGNFLYPVDEA
jgi:hypothetical protein